MGLMFPADLEAWRRWQRGRHRARALRGAARRARPVGLVLHCSAPEPRVLVAIDATTPTAVASVAEPLAHLGDLPLAVLAPADVSAHLPGLWSLRRLGPDRALPRELGGLRAVIAAGHYLPSGALAHEWARRTGAEFLVVQHGLLTPLAPPLPHGSTLLAFTERDGGYWTSERSDVAVEVIGSQLLWTASRHHVELDAAASPVFLGQLHGAELSRRVSAATASSFCRHTGAAYRPHPAETDRLSRWQHERWRRLGIPLTPGGPLLGVRAPVVSIFSTGVLEAAAAGIPAWVTCLTPPAWVGEFWERYRMAPWGGPPTKPPSAPDTEPALRVAWRARAAAEADR